MVKYGHHSCPHYFYQTFYPGLSLDVSVYPRYNPSSFGAASTMNEYVNEDIMAIYPWCLVCEDLVEDVLNLVNISDQSAGPAQCKCFYNSQIPAHVIGPPPTWCWSPCRRGRPPWPGPACVWPPPWWSSDWGHNLITRLQTLRQPAPGPGVIMILLFCHPPAQSSVCSP